MPNPQDQQFLVGRLIKNQKWIFRNGSDPHINHVGLAS